MLMGSPNTVKASEGDQGPPGDVILLPSHQLCRRQDGRTELMPRAKNKFRSERHWKTRQHKLLDWPEDAWRDPSKTITKHDTGAATEAALSADFLQRFTTAIVVRNPYARLYSAYRFTLNNFLRGRNRPEWLQRGGKPISFDDFVAGEASRNSLAARPQVGWLGSTRPGSILRTETLQEDLVQFLLACGVEQKQLARVEHKLSTRANVTTRPGEWEAMSDRARESIALHYAEDFAAFGYDPATGARR
jgi:hypothetical protein